MYEPLCIVLTSIPAVLNKPRELATVIMWPWFSSSILGRNALVVWGSGQRGEDGKEEKNKREVRSLVLIVCAKVL